MQEKDERAWQTVVFDELEGIKGVGRELELLAKSFHSIGNPKLGDRLQWELNLFNSILREKVKSIQGELARNVKES